MPVIAPLDGLQKPLGTGFWWACFILATALMKEWFQAFRVFTLTPSALHGLLLAGASLLLVLTVLLMIYDSYVQEALKGQVQKPVRLFERLIRNRFLLRTSLAQKEMKP